MGISNLVLIGTFASLCAGAATVLGAGLVFFLRNLTEKVMDFAMGIAAGVMLSATFFGLVQPAIRLGGVWKTAIGILVGTAFLIIMEKAIPHIHRVTGEKGPPAKLSKLLLFILAITIHNFPEGLSVGVGFAGGDIASGTFLAIAIGIQNIVEGLVVAIAFFRTTNKLAKAFLVASFTFVVEPVGGLIGISVVSMSGFLIPYGLAFAAGAMLFVTVEELIPETHSHGNVRESTMGIIVGFVVMMLLETLFA